MARKNTRQLISFEIEESSSDKCYLCGKKEVHLIQPTFVIDIT